MPTYLYEHRGPAERCTRGRVFTEQQSMKDEALTQCPACGEAVERVIAPTFISTPTGDSELKDKGFAKLVRRDKGVYENVTAEGSESRFWHANKPETMPDIKKRISD